jgi:Uma2 family endonuclease
MLLSNKTYTLDEFRDVIALPENTDRLFEFIHGEIIEKVPGRTRYSEFGHIIAAAVRHFCRARNLPCHTSGGDGAYSIGENVIAPDFAYKPTPMSEDYPDPVPPRWAVEVISPTDRVKDIRAKRRIYAAANILLWEVYREDLSVEVYAGGEFQVFGIDDTLTGGDVLPGFELPVREIFGD